jgi:DNA-binding NtrC family response regulator
MGTNPRLLAIVEMGGYPNFVPLYEELGYEVEVVNSQRKARNLLKRDVPDVIVAEYNFQSQFRDRTSNLETLMAVLQRHENVRVICFYEPGHAHKLAVLTERFPVFAALSFPVEREELEDALCRASPGDRT